MLSTTQQIDADFFSSYTRTKQNGKSNPAVKPSRWSATTISELKSWQFEALCQWYTEHMSFDGHLHCASQKAPVDINVARKLISVIEKNGAQQALLITAGVFTSGTLDFCRRHNVSLKTSKDLLRDILCLQKTQQRELLDRVFASAASDQQSASP